MASLIVSRFGTCEHFPQKHVPRRPNFNCAKIHPKKKKHIGWLGDLFGRYESLMFSGNKLSTSLQTEKKASFLSTYLTGSYRHWTFTKKLEKWVHLKAVLLTVGSFCHFYVPFSLEEVWSPAYAKDVITSPHWNAPFGTNGSFFTTALASRVAPAQTNMLLL